ncbi:hypothetical protein GCM10011609_57420 [Lentzea pudingi]|uniref:Glycosyltransferase involved in cell wall biogenesis n=1 Tax=Lentzea pudingi TaxID=1789439 RepID=A0ABQ2IG52_9PSEU|nr:DUF2064 domain-containing protein [Lentzea pudingi]GGN10182.1 hypothetical protein GCM10011609_57420 [Lentzea pudingi]
MRFCLLVMAKSPIPGQVKTRLCPPLSLEEAADVAAASLLDTVEAALETPGAVPVVALAGVVRREDVRDALAECVVIPQRGDSFAERLVCAHADVARFRMPVLQIGMDTPQVTPALLASCAEFEEAALGLALDGGWWALGLRDPLRAHVLRDVPMSRADTGARTLEALTRSRANSLPDNGGTPETLPGLRVRTLPALSDVDTIADAHAVAAQAPGSRFAAALLAIAAVPR